jgi:hypothetical protein
MSDIVATPVKSTKAIVGAIVSAVISALTVVATDLANPATDWTNLGTYIPILIAAAVGAGLVGASVYQTTNLPK